MRAEIHPDYHEIQVKCTCGNAFVTKSTYGADKLNIEICSKCHPFYTGEQKIIDTAGKVEKFNQKFGLGSAKSSGAQKAKTESDDQSGNKAS